MSLSQFPDEILNLISLRLDGFDIFCLWMACDLNLKQRLTSKIITQFSLEYKVPGDFLWPGNFLKRLERLSHLSIVADQQLDHIPVKNLFLYPVPTLKSLKLCFKGACMILDPKSSVYQNYSTESSTFAETNKYNSFAEYFCNLEHLEIKSISGQPEISITSLPKSLKSLSIPGDFLNFRNTKSTTISGFDLLPQTLTVLSMKFISKPDPSLLDWSKLPLNLTSLTTNIEFPQEKISVLPRNLEHLCLKRGERYDIQKIAPVLPTGLRSLSLGLIPGIAVHTTLEHLENLEDLFLHMDRNSKENYITKLPPKLKSLDCTFLRFADLTQYPLADGLTRLHLIQTVGISADLIRAIPSTVTDLSLTRAYQPLVKIEEFPYFSLLPKNLKSLDSNLSTIESTSLLPYSLTNLFLILQRSFDVSHFDGFPSTLERLHLLGSAPRSTLEQLPNSLKYLYIGYGHAPIDDSVIAKLPRGLKEITFVVEDYISDASAADYPPNLEYLKLPNNRTLTDHAIPKLPRSLTYLHLGGSQFSDEYIKHMPSKLVYLNLPNCSKITSESRKDLPRYLRTLNLPRCKDWGKTVTDMPPLLEEFCIGDIMDNNSYYTNSYIY